MNVDLAKTYYIGDTIHCTGALTRNGLPVNDALIYVYANGTKFGEASTDSLGIYDFTFTRTVSGALNVTARYEAP